MRGAVLKQTQPDIDLEVSMSRTEILVAEPRRHCHSVQIKQVPHSSDRVVGAQFEP